MHVTYYVNKEKKTVKAVLKLMPKERDDIITRINSTNWIRIPYAHEDKFRLNRTYTGTAQCLEEDTWNEEFGKQLARRKAYGKYLTARSKKLLKMLNNIINDENDLISISDKWVAGEDDYWAETEKFAGIYD